MCDRTLTLKLSGEAWERHEELTGAEELTDIDACVVMAVTTNGRLFPHFVRAIACNRLLVEEDESITLFNGSDVPPPRLLKMMGVVRDELTTARGHVISGLVAGLVNAPYTAI